MTKDVTWVRCTKELRKRISSTFGSCCKSIEASGQNALQVTDAEISGPATCTKIMLSKNSFALEKRVWTRLNVSMVLQTRFCYIGGHIY